jgi:hypothetical protein
MLSLFKEGTVPQDDRNINQAPPLPPKKKKTNPKQYKTPNPKQSD